MKQKTVMSPVGPLTLSEQEDAIAALRWGSVAKGAETSLLEEAASQLRAYFDGHLTEFDLPLKVKGSGFLQCACDAMSRIPMGETSSYGEIAKALGASARAVGKACGANPIPIIIPCHRVLGANSLGGYSGVGGIETKVWLLRHEGAGGLLI